MKAIQSHRLWGLFSLFFAVYASNAAAETHPEGATRIHPTLEIYDYEASDVCDVAARQVRVTFEGVTNDGILVMELYHDPGHFLNKKGRTRRVRVPAGEAPQLVCMNTPWIGRFAIASYHDIDADRKLDKKWNRTPKEPFGLSLNPKFKTLRFPKFEESAVYVDQMGINLLITLVRP